MASLGKLLGPFAHVEASDRDAVVADGMVAWPYLAMACNRAGIMTNGLAALRAVPRTSFEVYLRAMDNSPHFVCGGTGSRSPDRSCLAAEHRLPSVTLPLGVTSVALISTLVAAKFTNVAFISSCASAVEKHKLLNWRQIPRLPWKTTPFAKDIREQAPQNAKTNWAGPLAAERSALTTLTAFSKNDARLASRRRAPRAACTPAVHRYIVRGRAALRQGSAFQTARRQRAADPPPFPLLAGSNRWPSQRLRPKRYLPHPPTGHDRRRVQSLAARRQSPF